MNKLLTKIVGAALGATMAVGVGVGVAVNNGKGMNSEVNAAIGDPGDSVTWTWTASSNNKLSTTAGSQSLSGSVGTNTISITGTTSVTGGAIQNTYNSTDYGGQQMGTKSSTMTAFSITFGNPWSGTGTYKNYTKITSVSLSGSSYSALTSTVSVTVGGKSAIADGETTLFKGTGVTPRNCSFTPASDSDSGVIVISVNSSGSRAWYLTSFSITAEVPSQAQTTHTVTYSDGNSNTYPVSNITEGTTHNLLSVSDTGFVAPSNKMFKCWKIGNTERAVGYALTVNSDTTVEAVWTDKLSITYKANNGSEEADVVVYFASGTDQTIANNSETNFTAPSSKVFNGWSTTSTGTGGTSYAADSTQTALSTSLVLYAQWLKVGPTVTFDLSAVSYESASAALVTWSNSKVTMENAVGTSTTAPNNYLPDAQSSSRFYKNNVLTLTPAEGFEIMTATFVATTSGYASALANSSWTNATTSADNTTVTISFTNGSSPASAIIGGTCGFTSVTFQFAALKTFTITPSDTEVEVNDIIQVEANVSGVEWTSSNNTIATVDEDGYIEGKSVGQVTITGTKAGYEDNSVVINVIQSTQPYINLSLIVNGDDSSTSGYTGQTFSVTASYANLESDPDAIQWSTSGTGSVTRTAQETGDTYSGTLTSAGTARITAKDTDGDTTAYVEITISQSTISGFSIDKTSLKLYVDDTETITATITEATGIYDKTVTWTTSDSSVATVDNGVVTAEGFGDAVITARAGDGQTKTCSVSVNEELNDISESNPIAVNYTFGSKDVSGTNTELTYSGNGLSVVVSNGTSDKEGDHVRVFKNQTITFSATNITSIVITCNSNKPITGLADMDGFVKDTVNNTGTWTGQSNEVIFTASGEQTRIVSAVVSYTNEQTVHYVNTDDSYNAQKAAIQFAKGFNARLEGICKDSSKGQGQTDTVALSAAWNGTVEGKQSCLQIFTTAYATLTTEADRTAFKNILNKAESVEGGDVLQDALARYDWIVENRGLDDFLAENLVRDSVVESANPSLTNILANNTTVTAAIVIISVISLSTLCGYFLLRKRKEER